MGNAEYGTDEFYDDDNSFNEGVATSMTIELKRMFRKIKKEENNCCYPPLAKTLRTQGNEILQELRARGAIC